MEKTKQHDSSGLPSFSEKNMFMLGLSDPTNVSPLQTCSNPIVVSWVQVKVVLTLKIEHYLYLII